MGKMGLVRSKDQSPGPGELVDAAYAANRNFKGKSGGAPVTNNVTTGDVSVSGGMGAQDIAQAVRDAISDQMQDLLDGLQNLMEIEQERSLV